jgi:hypothetical protein
MSDPEVEPPDDAPAPLDPAPLDPATFVRAFAWISIAAALVLTIAKIFARFDVATLWDDAYMFHRYARNLLSEGRLSWNPGGGATYGLTTPMVLALTVPLHFITGGNPALTVMLTSTVAGVAFLGLLVWLWRGTAGSSTVKLLGMVLVAACFALSNTTEHFVSGMDTMFGLAYFAGWLVALRWMDRRRTLRSALIVGALGGLAFWARPELIVPMMLAPAALASFAPEADRRRAGWIALLTCTATLAAVLAFNRLYFQSWLPLPFYAKSLRLYGDNIWWIYQGGSTNEIVAFLISYWPLFTVIGLDVVTGARRWWRREPADLALTAGAAVCLLYYWLGPLPVMPFSQRFYQPVLPSLFYLTWRGLSRLEELALRSPGAERSPLFAAIACASMAALWTELVPAALTSTRDAVSASLWQRMGRFSVKAHAKEAGPQGYWFKVDLFSKLPDDLVIATTEVGLLSALNPDKVIVDLAGLNERSFAHGHFQAAGLFEKYQPDLIYMPHPHYNEMVKALKKSPAFREYEAFDKESLGTKEFGLALHKRSPHYDAMKSIVARYRPK